MGKGFYLHPPTQYAVWYPGLIYICRGLIYLAAILWVSLAVGEREKDLIHFHLRIWPQISSDLDKKSHQHATQLS